MPSYQMWCEKCHEPYEVTMKLAVFEEFSEGKIYKRCPECKTKLKNLICPPKLVLVDSDDNPGTYKPISRHKDGKWDKNAI